MLTFRYTGADGKMIESEILTSGMVGKKVKLEFSGDWDGLTKTAVFTAGPVTRDVTGVSDLVAIPAEVLANPLQQLYVGVYGISDDGKVTPTIRAEGPRIRPGVDPSGDAGTDPDLPVWAQIEQRVLALEQKGTGGGTSDLPQTPAAAAMDYDMNVHCVNHRGYSAAAPENTIPAYIKSREMGFTYAEADISFTSDGVAVLLHDATIDRTSNGSGSISAMTYDAVSQYDFGSWKSSAYKGTRIPTFEEFIILCKQIGLHPYIELKQNGAYTEAQIRGLVETVCSSGMQGKVTWISFASSYLEYVKTADPSARLGYLLDGAVSDAVIATVSGLMTGENEVFLDMVHHKVTDAGAAMLASAGIPLEVWTVNSESAIQELSPYITGVTSDNLIAGKVLYEAGMVYEYGLGGDHVHSYTSDVTTAATCTAAGVRTYTCSCGHSYTETIAASGHQYVNGVCAVCGKTGSGDEAGGGESEAAGDALHAWDFTASMTDQVTGEAAATNMTRSSDGVVFSTANQYVQLGSEKISMLDLTVEIDIAECSMTQPEKHARLLGSNYAGTEPATNDKSHALVWRYNNSPGWWWYNSSVWLAQLDSTQYPINYFDGKTIRLYIDSDGNGWLYAAEIGSDAFMLLAELGYCVMDNSRSSVVFILGGSVDNALIGCTISGVRMYRGKKE